MGNFTFASYKKTMFCLPALLLCTLVACAQTANESMNETLQTIHNRKSVRAYTNQAVPKEKVEVLLKAAMVAPSSRDNQPWLFYVVTNRETLNKLAERLPSAQMLAKAPMAIIVCGDNAKNIKQPDQALNWALDCSAASQNLLLAAESEGLGAVWTGVFPYKDRVKVVQDVLQLPENIVPLNAIPIGYPAGNEKPKNKYKPENIRWIE